MTLAVDVMWVVLAAAIVFYTTVVMGVASNQNSPALGLRMDRAYLSLRGRRDLPGTPGPAEGGGLCLPAPLG